MIALLAARLATAAEVPSLDLDVGGPRPKTGDIVKLSASAKPGETYRLLLYARNPAVFGIQLRPAADRCRGAPVPDLPFALVTKDDGVAAMVVERHWFEPPAWIGPPTAPRPPKDGETRVEFTVARPGDVLGASFKAFGALFP